VAGCRPNAVAIAGLFVLNALLGACGGDGSVNPPPPGKRLVVQGRLERGVAVRFALAGPTDTVPVVGSALTISPTASGTIAGDSVVFTQAGAVHLAALVSGTTTTLDTAVAVPPTIVFDALFDGQRDIYRAALDGVGLARLTTSLSEDSHPSAANQLIVFTSYRDGNGELYQIRADGSAEHRITNTPTNETIPALAPNGQSIAYVNVTDTTGLVKIWLAPIGFGTSGPLSAAGSANPSIIESGVAWSPTSDRVVFVSNAAPSGRAGLFLAAASGSAAATWINGSGNLGPEVEPAWSFSGKSIAYASARGDTTTIFVRDVESGVETQIVHGHRSLGQPAWLPDGRIVFTDFASPNPVLEWVDPAAPGVVHLVAVTAPSAQHAAALVLP
jgi:TolB protein